MKKDWKKTLSKNAFIRRDGGFLNIYQFMPQQFRVEVYNKNHKRIVEKRFKSKAQALAYAKSYMRRN